MIRCIFKRARPLAISGMSLVLASVTVFACLNPIGESYILEAVPVEGTPQEFFKAFTTHKDHAYWEDVQNQIEDRRKNHPDTYDRNNLAVALAHLGKNKEAIVILKELEKKRPGSYSAAANLGTAYELNGENENALHWIKEGVARNSDGHNGSEWLHVKILEAKLRLKEQRNWLATNTVLGADVASFGNSTETKTSVVDHLSQPKTLKEIESALVYQLHERLEFIKPPEPVVADLLTDLSTVFSITRTPEHSQVIYELAKSYGSTRTPVLIRPGAPKEEASSENKGFFGFGITTILLIGFGVLLVTFVGWRYFTRTA